MEGGGGAPINKKLLQKEMKIISASKTKNQTVETKMKLNGTNAPNVTSQYAVMCVSVCVCVSCCVLVCLVP